MPPSKDPSLIRHYVNSLSESDEWDRQKERYEDEEPLAGSKSWKEFLRLAISREELEGRSADAKAVIREGSKVVSKTQLKPNGLMGFGKRTDPYLDLALANLERRARRWAEKRHGHDDAGDRRHSQGHEPRRRRSHHDRVEEDAPRRRGKRGRIIVMKSHHLRCHQADEEDAEPRMPAIHEEEVRPNPLQGRGYGPAPPQEYVYRPRPPILPPPHQQSLTGTTAIGSGYSSYLPDSNTQGSYAARSGRDNMVHGGSRDGSQGRVSGVSRESTRSGHIACTDNERRDPEAIVICLTGKAVAATEVEQAEAVRVGVGQVPGYLKAGMGPEATFAYPTGDSVAVAVRLEQATGDLEADIRMTGTQDS